MTTSDGSLDDNPDSNIRRKHPMTAPDGPDYNLDDNTR
jgi:hypothetical protein